MESVERFSVLHAVYHVHCTRPTLCRESRQLLALMEATEHSKGRLAEVVSAVHGLLEPQAGDTSAPAPAARRFFVKRKGDQRYLSAAVECDTTFETAVGLVLGGRLVNWIDYLLNGRIHVVAEDFDRKPTAAEEAAAIADITAARQRSDHVSPSKIGRGMYVILVPNETNSLDTIAEEVSEAVYGAVSQVLRLLGGQRDKRE